MPPLTTKSMTKPIRRTWSRPACRASYTNSYSSFRTASENACLEVFCRTAFLTMDTAPEIHPSSALCLEAEKNADCIGVMGVATIASDGRRGKLVWYLAQVSRVTGWIRCTPVQCAQIKGGNMSDHQAAAHAQNECQT